MALLSLLTETRGIGLNTPEVGQGTDAFFQILFGGSLNSMAGEVVSEETALGVTAIWQAVNIIANTMSVLPLHLYKTTPKNGKVRADNDPLYKILHDQVNTSYVTSFQWRKMMMMRLLLGGRAFSFIERNRAGRVQNIWYLDPDRMQVSPSPDGFGRIYTYQQPNNKQVTYTPDEIIDLVYMPAANGIDHLSPVSILRNAIGLAIAGERYASTVFQNGGVPQMAATGPITSPDATARAAAMLKATLERARETHQNFLVMPEGYDLKPLGFDPSKSQLLELRKFQVIEIARVYNVSPSMLMDMTTGTFTNVEQQDLAFSKHTVHHWTELWEQELNAKLITDRNKTMSIEFNMDGLQRGSFETRFTAYAQGIQNGIFAPNEVRAKENLSPMEGGDNLFINSTMISLKKATETPPPNTAPADPEPADDPADTADDAPDTANAVTS
jgi:HK97 family phage portal protein